MDLNNEEKVQQVKKYLKQNKPTHNSTNKIFLHGDKMKSVDSHGFRIAFFNFLDQTIQSKICKH